MTLRSSPTAQADAISAIRVLLVHNHALVRAGLRLLIESQKGFRLVGETHSCQEAVVLAERERPDVILLDHGIGFNNESGLEHIPLLQNASGNAKVLLLTASDDPELHQRAIYQGAIGLIHKDEAPELFLKAIQKVNDGEAWLDRLTIGNLITGMFRNTSRKMNGRSPKPIEIDSLTKRERDIIELVAQGLKNKQIGKRLLISEVTVRHHLTSIFDKLGLEDRYELMIYAYKHGISDIPR